MKVGAYAVERDYSHYVAYASKTILAVVGTATKGPIGEVTAVTSSQDLVNKFGPLKTDCFGLYAGQYFLSQSSKMYFVRVAGENVAAASLVISGSTADEDTIDEALKLEVLEKGTLYNGFKVLITAGADDHYTITVKDKENTVLESTKDIELVDLVSGYQTKYFKIVSNDLTVAKLTAGTYEFVNGNDGIADITSAEYINGAKKLVSEQIDCNLIAVPGISDASVVTSVLSVAEERGDCLYLVDSPKGLTRDGVIAWVNGGTGYEHTAFNSSYGAVYFDWLNIYDSVNKVQVQVPPSVAVCASYAYSDRVSDFWYAPAGLTRGLIRGVLSTATQLNTPDIELLYESNINAIYEDPQVGLVIWGQKTLARQDTALNRVNVRRLMNYMKKIVTAACKYLVFEPNDRLTWNSFELKILPVLNSIKSRRGLYEYRIVKGETIVTSEDIDNYKMPCMVMIKPTKAAEEIPIYFVITSTGADFNEVLESNGVI